jgi:glycosyltransferase involved in cell wall biosynthesis
MLSLHNMAGTWVHQVDRYIALNEFGRDKFIEGGLPADKIAERPNFVFPEPDPGPGDGDFVVFVGRLDESKGVRTLLRAWQLLGREIPLRIIGDGPLAAIVSEFVKKNEHTTWLGGMSFGDTLNAIGQANLLVMCSQWYEGQPRVIIEAFAKGTPVVAPRLGAMREMIEEGITGRFFEPGDAEGLAQCVTAIMAERNTLTGMRIAARQAFEQKYGSSAGLDKLLQIYEEAMDVRKAVDS